MAPRIAYAQVAPEALRAMLNMERYIRESGLEYSLTHLMKVRASQINGCAYCIDMHTKDARAAGETEQRLYGLSAWHETPFYTDRERAALAWTDTLTLIGDGGVPDELYEEVSQHFSEKEIVDLTMVVITINGWNRMAISLRAPVGDYQPGSVAV